MFSCALISVIKALAQRQPADVQFAGIRLW